MPQNATYQSVAQAVKAETETAHIQVEEILLPKLNSIATISDYITILKMFYGIFQPVENLIHQFISKENLPDVEERRSSLFIRSDLEALHYDTSHLPTTRSLPKIENRQQAFGALYVLEGSTLGGKMIAKMLAKNEAVTIPDTALNFFSGYREKTGPMWTGFLAELNKQPDVTEVTEAANDTFLSLKSWMQQSFNHE